MKKGIRIVRVPFHRIKCSKINTVIQHALATTGKPLPFQANKIPTMSAIPPAIGDIVACTIAGKVMTANVT